jgi:hypothetical protein
VNLLTLFFDSQEHFLTDSATLLVETHPHFFADKQDFFTRFDDTSGGYQQRFLVDSVTLLSMTQQKFSERLRIIS